MITYDNVEIRFGDFVAVPNLNLTIEKGEFFTLLGPSGCGKTTILRALAGFVTPSKGRILIDGKDVTKVASDKRNIGMVFQNYALFPSLTVKENIAFGLKVAKKDKAEIEERVANIAKEVELNQKQLARGISELSGGQQQRVAIARAMVMRPKILLLDEPLSNLDAKLRHQMRIQLKEMQTHFGITSVYVTHDQDEALAMSDRIAVLNAGHMEQCGTPREVSTEFVCNFLGDVNRLEPRVSQRMVDAGATNIDPTLPSYLRIEKVRLAAKGEPTPPGLIAVEGVVAGKSYHGINYTYELKLGQTTMKSVVPEDGMARHFEPGDPVVVLTNPENVLQYPETQNEKAAA
ncbi:ABC transporter ATP-binding protein [Cutibacterium equinum]|uniref:ABC transporter ATP-binding protein n=1 Tax=Cutibacterium equinum TaxID=3016342 RepID=A0ABY7R2H9_9ACTN|nr:ABC transporter ATP-binding protein [Cutibacterium equinum]WCC80913.1 ABC transporter ATP-binding protein [Cutibacterium equinum]